MNLEVPAQEIGRIHPAAGSTNVDNTLAEVAVTLATGVVSTLASSIHDDNNLGMTQAPAAATYRNHDNTVSAWQALWGIFVILLIFTPLAGCYIYLVKQGMRGDLDLNWESLENKPKNQLQLARPVSSTIDMPPSRKNSTCVEPHPGSNIMSETISDTSSVGSFDPTLMRNDSCSQINLEDL